MRALIVGLALSVSATAMASESLCDAYADVMYTVAEQRDSGVSRREVRAMIIRETDADMHQVLLGIADLAYQRPHYTPEQEADNFYTECMKSLGATQTRLNF
jgi:hypothetical protein